MKIAFVGMGSIAKRHFSNVTEYLTQHGISFEIDIFRSGKGNALPDEIAANVNRVRSVSEPLTPADQYDVVFVTNPTSSHYETVAKFARHTRSFFVEKPVFDRTDVDLEALQLPENTVCYVACPLRYHPVIQYVRENIPCREAYAVRAISSSYLPDWRPGTDYRQTYSAHKDMGGGVDIDLIHEWDYLACLFGPVRSGTCLRTRISHLEIDSNDIACYLARTDHAVLELHLDYFGRSAIRQLQIFLPEETVTADLLSGEVLYHRSGRHVVLDSARNHFQQAEISHFFDILSGRCANDNDLTTALKTLQYTQGIF